MREHDKEKGIKDNFSYFIMYNLCAMRKLFVVLSNADLY